MCPRELEIFPLNKLVFPFLNFWSGLDGGNVDSALSFLAFRPNVDLRLLL